MDDLIFTFTQEQYKIFLQIQERAKREELTIEFDFSIPPYTDIFSKNVGDIINGIRTECGRLLEFEPQNGFFSTSLSGEEIKRLIPAFYDVINKTDALRCTMYAAASDISKELSKWQGHENRTNELYALFLPYKAALLENGDYTEKIVQTEDQYLSAMDSIIKRKEEFIAMLCTVGTVCDHLIPDFLEEISRAADTPRFEKFNDRAFFTSVRNFIQRINNYK